MFLILVFGYIDFSVQFLFGFLKIEKIIMVKGEGVVKSDEFFLDFDQYVKEVFDEIFGKEEQFYDEFVQSFMFLNKGE